MKNFIVSKLSDSRLCRVAKDLLAMLQPAIRLQTFPCGEDELPLGSTRIGGRPDLADNVVWPSWNGKPLAFLAQLNLGDLTRFPFASVLPKEGWLLFFYDCLRYLFPGICFFGKELRWQKIREFPIKMGVLDQSCKK